MNSTANTNGHVHLFVDADDTLWENNIYFEKAFLRFSGMLGHSSLSSAEVRAHLDEIENVNRIRYGYGALQFGRNMQECYRALSEKDCREEELEAVMALAMEIMAHPLHLIEGVEATLGYLAAHYPVTLFTKGDPAEQTRKVESSGLASHFSDIVVAREKDEDAYVGLLARRGAKPESSWMIGNSPKSDINPALAVGMNAVYIPHERNWHLEHEEIVPGGGRFIELAAFRDLRQHF